MAPKESDERSTADSRGTGESLATSPFVSRRLLIGLPLVSLVASLLVGGVAAWFAFGLPGLLVCLAVWSVIAVSSVLSYVAGSVFATPDLAQAQIVVGMMIRTGVPLIFALVVTQAARGWLEVGCVYYLFGFYFVGLTVDVFLILATSPLVGSSGNSVQVGR